ncbi:LysR family transcriptional regulator [Paraburkholderia fynbosensis]|uniref:HTH-type transcriptional regulator PgrR n=1 Tax=Paraburkholderia fynbosensis TaxID=1200993 RepID=A0A6J5GK38_9BURK|nr:LysR family transcriptional regulator [Paraburkholderia fynbosensis]CAB3800452.1 HTH-type transcriptional regulator PgrR [Paraburkholderia fynbosensis]
MRRENYNDLLAFIAVARERSFTRASAQLGVSQSALSHTIRSLESRLGLRLLTRTTRSVAPTEAGERLLLTVAPRFEEIESELAAVTEFRDKPAGTIRITATDYATKTILWPRLSKVLRKYPEIKVEIMTDYGLSDIVAERYDIGVRTGDQVAKDMIAVRIAPDMRMAIVGSPGYLAERELPRKPQDLTAHNCINLRLPTLGGFYPWELKKGSRAVQARVEGQFAFNGTYQMLDAALSGYGLAYVPADLVQAHVAAGRLVRVLEDWCPTFPGLHAYYANRREFSRAMTVVIDALRYRPEDTKP